MFNKLIRGGRQIKNCLSAVFRDYYYNYTH
nr:MAG TPA: hypothetical protein [Caudoviricetes sp.]